MPNFEANRMTEDQGTIRVLVLATDYPGINRKEAHRFVHVRNLFYQTQGIDVTVLNFAAKADYQYEGIPVVCPQTYKTSVQQYDLLLSHQPNIRQHYLFLRRYGDRFPRFVLFFHGHEALRFSKAYPKPYSYVSSSKVKALLRDMYDIFKLSVWRRYIPKMIDKTTLIFVSQWMFGEFQKSIRLTPDALKGHYHIIYNGVGELFEKKTYDAKKQKAFDFVMIRGNLDGSKYGVDLVNELAKNNPEAKFLMVGKGKYFDHNDKPSNLVWENRTLNHQEILDVLDSARCALMPTRQDTQGLMTCEMATYGMPVITSDIPVCHEVLDSFPNVYMIGNDAVDTQLLPICASLEKQLPYLKNDVFFKRNTCAHEVEVIKKLASEKRK